ncbi:MAG: hypothetical protein IJS52_05815 [Bacilli bacterium]|nr:hypothetical protein [Bacilli bacterium]
MTRLQVKDLTPEMLAEVCKLNAADDVVKYFADKGFEVSPALPSAFSSRARRAEPSLAKKP